MSCVSKGLTLPCFAFLLTRLYAGITTSNGKHFPVVISRGTQTKLDLLYMEYTILQAKANSYFVDLRLAQTNNTVSASFIVGPCLYPCRVDRNNDGTYNGRFDGVTVCENATLITVLKGSFKYSQT